MKKIVILISGRGSNMEAILETARREKWDSSVVAVISNRPDAKGLEVAARYGVPTAVVASRGSADRASFDAALQREIDRHAPDLVVLAGFMRILTPAFVAHYEGRLLNIHPSLLPAFTGLDTHARAIAAGVRFHGATVHFVTAELDVGPIVDQAVVPVLPDDSEQTLARRVLEQEHRIYPRAVRHFVEGRLRIVQGRVMLAPGAANTGSA
ncbi:phosphoribosylglycinamide formyltransferase [Lacisediminimonas sp.]|uniref:phosphoribosylglycinamide formyltransferase n=1 Tax=Lacisediminimonas sp. TaxID=3060582 RepID=UPI0027249902|nr:phosphoribosylglycinamide formyltransferase [Lacisediminimonas sp.]MDO8300832.1 phosphoribosylglycinamide formyltransferase [Lacisediminimonas sp.]